MIPQHPGSTFGRRLRMARQQADIPQDKLGVQIGLDEGTASARISRYETGIHEPPFGIAVKIAQVLGVPTAYFYCEDDDLAGVILAWGKLRTAQRKNILALLDSNSSST